MPCFHLFRLERCDINKCLDLGIITCCRDDRASVAVTDENDISVLLIDYAHRGCDVLVEACQRLLDNADIVAVAGQDVINAAPARTIHERAMDKDDVARVR